MGHRCDDDLLVLHALRVKGFAEPDAVAVVTALPLDTVRSTLDALAARGGAIRREGRISGWALTPDGRAEHADRLAADIEAAGCHDEAEAAYESFLALNHDLKDVCTAWQVRDLDANVLNDHTDPAYDAAVVERLAELHAGTRPLLDRLADADARFGPYAARFETALERVRAGERDWFAKPLIDSYHTVWMELHEDLLVTLARSRDDRDGA